MIGFAFKVLYQIWKFEKMDDVYEINVAKLRSKMTGFKEIERF